MADRRTESLSNDAAKIVAKNRELIARLGAADFNPGFELDNTRNGSSYLLTDFFDDLRKFPHGEVPTRLTDELVETTDELIAAIRARYGSDRTIDNLAILAGLAFRRSKRVWRIRRPKLQLTPKQYGAELKGCLEAILDALDDLNAALDGQRCPPPGVTAAKRLSGRRSSFQERQMAVFEAYLLAHPVTRSVTASARAHRCWLEHAREWDRAAGEDRLSPRKGYSSYKELARAYRNS